MVTHFGHTLWPHTLATHFGHTIWSHTLVTHFGHTLCGPTAVDIKGNTGVPKVKGAPQPLLTGNFGTASSAVSAVHEEVPVRGSCGENHVLSVGCTASRQPDGVSQGRLGSDICTRCHTEIEAVDQTCYLTWSHDVDTAANSPSAAIQPPGQPIPSLLYGHRANQSHRCYTDTGPINPIAAIRTPGQSIPSLLYGHRANQSHRCYTDTGPINPIAAIRTPGQSIPSLLYGHRAN